MRLVACLCLALMLTGCGNGNDHDVKIWIHAPKKAKLGETVMGKVVAIPVKEKGFKGEVKVEIESPKGVKVAPSSFAMDLKIKERVEKEFEIALSADAKPGEIEMKVKCTPEGGKERIDVFKIQTK